MISFTVHGTPAPAGSKRGFYNAKAKRVIITDDSQRSRPWKAQIADAAAEAMNGRDLLEGPLLLEVTFWMPRPKGHFNTKGELNAAGRRTSHPAVKPDLLKLTRALEDAISGVVYRDDAQIVTETLQKAYTTGSARCHVRVVPVVPAGEHRAERTEAAA